MEKTLLKTFTKYVLLNVMGMIGLSCYILADTYFIAGSLMADGLTALNLAIPVFSLISGVGLMLGVGGGTRYSVFIARGDRDKANQTFTAAVKAGIVIGFIFMLVGIFASPALGRLLGADAQTLEFTTTYLQVILCAAPLFILNNIANAFVRNDGNPRRAMTAMMLGSLSNIVLDYIFIYPLHWGMFGAAFATALAPFIGLITLSGHFIRSKSTACIYQTHTSLKELSKLVAPGMPAFIGELSSAAVLIVFNLVILSISGNTGVAAYGVVANLALVAIAILNGIAQGVQPVMSNAYGKNDKKSLSRLLKYALILALLAAALIYLVILLFSPQISDLFNQGHDAKLAGLANSGLKIYFAGFFAAGINIVIAAYLSVKEKPRSAFIVSMLRGFILILPAVFALSALLGMNGVWLTFPLAEGLTAIIAIIFLKNKKAHST